MGKDLGQIGQQLVKEVGQTTKQPEPVKEPSPVQVVQKVQDVQTVQQVVTQQTKKDSTFDRQDSLTFKGPQVNLPTPPVVVKKYAKIRYAKPTVTANTDFNPEKWAEALRKSMKGLGTNEQLLIE